MIYMGDFNTRYPELWVLSPNPNQNGIRLLEHIFRHQLSRRDNGSATHSRGGTLDHIIISGLVASHVNIFIHPYILLRPRRTQLPLLTPSWTSPIPSHIRLCIPPRNCPTCISYMSNLLPAFDLKSPEKSYSSLVNSTHNFHSHYVSRPHIKRRSEAYLMNVSSRRKRKWWRMVSHSKTSLGAMWHLINKVVKKKSSCALHHSPVEYAQGIVEIWSDQSQARNLPEHIQEAFSSQSNLRTLRLLAALLKVDEKDTVEITEEELRRALIRDKSRIFSPRNPGTLPEFIVGDGVILLCTRYIYLDAPVRITPVTPERQRVHSTVRDLIDQLQQRLTPLMWFTKKAAGIYIPVARTVYIIFILGCPTSTRRVNKQTEHNLPSLVKRTYAMSPASVSNVFTFPTLPPIILMSLAPPLTHIHLGLYFGQNLDIDTPVAEVDHDLPPWRIPCPALTFTHTSKADPPLLQKQLALETIHRVSTSIPVVHFLYTDGSLQADESGGALSSHWMWTHQW
ncbi:hypothetical protein Hamer_G023627, partial [Homarus americanus]